MSPTGYTADVGDGKLTDFSAFALRCARQFGAFVLMRDESLDAPAPERFKASDHHRRAERKALTELMRLSRLSLADQEEEYQAALTEGIRQREEWDRKAQDTVDRYNEMLAQVRAWEPPTPDHDGLKRFMVQQLEESIKFDGPMDRKYRPKLARNASEHHAERLADAKRDVAYHVEEHRKEVERTKGRNEWVRQLRDSLPRGAVVGERVEA